LSALKNSRHEIFARELATGKSATEAMRNAGYSDVRNSTRLTKNDEVKHRVKELQEKGALRTEITIASLVAELEEARQLALGRGQLSAAVSATMGKAKITGQIVDRAEVRNVGEYDRMTDEELRESAIVNIVAMGIEYHEEILEAARERKKNKI
jgi:phage terminase small subunit